MKFIVSLSSSILANIGHWNRWGISFPLTDIEANKAAAAVVKVGGRICKERGERVGKS